MTKCINSATFPSHLWSHQFFFFYYYYFFVFPPNCMKNGISKVAKWSIPQCLHMWVGSSLCSFRGPISSCTNSHNPNYIQFIETFLHLIYFMPKENLPPRLNMHLYIDIILIQQSFGSQLKDVIYLCSYVSIIDSIMPLQLKAFQYNMPT